jgi:hypothetical protein
MSTAPSSMPRRGTPERSKKTRPGVPAVNLSGATPEARRWAAAILEVLAGVRTPTEAAEALAVSLPRYYAMELRALHGLLAGCEPRPVGRVQSPHSQLQELQKECERLRRQAARQQALLRVAQRTVGLPAATANGKTAAGKEAGAKKGRRRRPRARALRVVERLQEGVPAAGPAIAVESDRVCQRDPEGH